MTDQFNCNIAHYATRQGHLTILIWINEKLSIDFKIQDSYGYGVLDYSVIYKKLNCFMFLVFKCGLKQFNYKHADHLAEVLCKNYDDASKSFILIILNDKELCA